MGRKLVQGEIVDVFYSKRIPFGGDVTLYNLKKTDGKIYRAGVMGQSYSLKKGEKVEIFVDPYKAVGSNRVTNEKETKDGGVRVSEGRIIWGKILTYKKLS